jgi:hypothetical protein
MARSHLGVLLTDADGDIQASTVLTIQKADGTSLGQTIYDAASGGSSIPSPTTDAGGRFDGYVDVPVRSRVTPTGGTARIEDFAPDPGDVLIQNMTVPAVLGGYDGTSPVLSLRPLDDVNAYALRVRDDDGSDILRVRKSAAGRNLILLGDDGSLPETSLLHAYQSLSANSQQVANIDAFIGASGLVDVKGLNVTATLSIAGSGNMAAGKFLAVRGSAASVGETVAVKGWVQANKVGGSPKLNVALWASSVGTQVVDTGLLLDGSGGYTDFIRGYNAADSLIFRVGVDGTVTATTLALSSGLSVVNITASGNITCVGLTASGSAVVNALTVTTSMSVVNVTSNGTINSTVASSAGAPTLRLSGGASPGVAGLYAISQDVIGISTASSERLRLDASGNVVMVGPVATTATNGFLYIPATTGTPTGVPTSYSGRAPMVWDASANKLWIYSSGSAAWKGVTLT